MAKFLKVCQQILAGFDNRQWNTLIIPTTRFLVGAGTGQLNAQEVLDQLPIIDAADGWKVATSPDSMNAIAGALWDALNTK